MDITPYQRRNFDAWLKSGRIASHYIYAQCAQDLEFACAMWRDSIVQITDYWEIHEDQHRITILCDTITRDRICDIVNAFKFFRESSI